jgi:hypothetical protein
VSRDAGRRCLTRIGCELIVGGDSGRRFPALPPGNRRRETPPTTGLSQKFTASEREEYIFEKRPTQPIVLIAVLPAQGVAVARRPLLNLANKCQRPVIGSRAAIARTRQFRESFLCYFARKSGIVRLAPNRYLWGRVGKFVASENNASLVICPSVRYA